MHVPYQFLLLGFPIKGESHTTVEQGKGLLVRDHAIVPNSVAPNK